MPTHHRPPIFDAPGSPLHGKIRPADWPGMAFPAKCEALVRAGLARDFRHAAQLMGRHAAVVRKARARARGAAARKDQGAAVLRPWWMDD